MCRVLMSYRDWWVVRLLVSLEWVYLAWQPEHRLTVRRAVQLIKA